MFTRQHHPYVSSFCNMAIWAIPILPSDQARIPDMHVATAPRVRGTLRVKEPFLISAYGTGSGRSDWTHTVSFITTTRPEDEGSRTIHVHLPEPP